MNSEPSLKPAPTCLAKDTAYGAGQTAGGADPRASGSFSADSDRSERFPHGWWILPALLFGVFTYADIAIELTK